MQKYTGDLKCAVMSRDEVRAFDSWAINEIGAPGVILMENAGRSCAELIKGKLAGISKPNGCIFCGTGNNGGDGYVIARHLLNSSFEVTVVICGNPEKIKGDARINLEILQRLGYQVEQLDLTKDVTRQISDFADGADVIVDALFGTGLKGRLKDEYVALIDAINQSDGMVVAVDVPSGLDCDMGKPLGTAVKADYTVTFAAVKKGFTSEKAAADYTGEIYVAPIGVVPAG